MFPRRPPAGLAAWLVGAAAAGRAGARGGGLLALLANQCRFVTGLRVRRAQQIAQLYGRLYSESSRRVLLGRLWRRLRGRPGHASALMAALAGVFVWDEERIREEELQRWARWRGRASSRGWGRRGWEVETLKPGAGLGDHCLPLTGWYWK